MSYHRSNRIASYYTGHDCCRNISEQIIVTDIGIIGNKEFHLFGFLGKILLNKVMDFKNFLLENWETLDFTRFGYKVQVGNYSNKGPVIRILDSQNQEITRARFDMLTNKWHVGQ